MKRLTIAGIFSVQDFERYGEHWIMHHAQYGDVDILTGVTQEAPHVPTTYETANYTLANGVNIRNYDINYTDFSFAYFKNQLIDYANSQYILFVDADEEVANLRRVGETTVKDFDGAFVTVFSFGNAQQGTMGTRECLPQVRLFDTKYRYRYKCHEQVVPDIEEKNGTIIDTPIVLLHTGYENRKQIPSKARRNAKLLLDDAKSGDLYPVAMLWRELNILANNGEFENAILRG